jgi:YaiO family outer membrane protein
MMRNMTTIIIISMFLILTVNAVWSQEIPDEGRQTVLGVGGFYYSVTDHTDQEGIWQGGRFRATNSPPRGMLGFTGIFEIVAENRDDPALESNGIYFVGSGYYDWTRTIFSYSSFGYGTDYPFVRFSTHHEVNFKLTNSRKWIVGLGGGYVDYHKGDSSPYFSLGSAYYLSQTFSGDPLLVLQYQYRRYFTEISGAQLNGHIVAAQFRWDTGSTTCLRYVFGQENVRLSSSLLLSDIRLGGESFSLEHNQPLSPNFGFTLAVSYAHKYLAELNSTVARGSGIEFGIYRKL